MPRSPRTGRRPCMRTLLGFLVPLLALSGPSQAPDPAPAPAPPLSAARSELVPGELPASATPEARALWAALLSATASKGQGGVRAFDMEFDANARRDQQSNQFSARYRYLEDGGRPYVRVTMTQSQRERLRGPSGDFLLQKGQPPLRIEGRELKEDKRELDETVGIARTFAGLSDPRKLRIARLELASAAPPQLPAELAKSAAALRWIELSSPDFQRGQADGALYRVHLGLDPKTSLPALAIVAREQGPAIELETAQLVELGSFAEVDGYKIPKRVRTFQPDVSQAPWVFASTPSLVLYFKSGTLKPQLKREDFLPPEK